MYRLALRSGLVKHGIYLKYRKLRKILESLKSVIVAYSGGLDSSFLLTVSVEMLGNKVIAVTSASPSLPKRELKEARSLAKRLGVRHLVIKTGEFGNAAFLENPPQRCYYCKKELFGALENLGKKYGIRNIVDGSNTDDDSDFRPGNRAKKEFRVRSPLKEASLSKSDIRFLSKALRLSFWQKPSFACLSSRIPYHSRIDAKRLKRIEKAEDFLISLGFRQVRVRDFGKLAKIEVDKTKVNKLVTRSQGRKVARYLKKLGYARVAVDLEGYKSGVFNDQRHKR